MSNDEAVKTVCIIPFSGKDKDWNRWSKTFLAIATTRQYKNELVPPDNYVSIPMKNDLAYNDLLLSCQEEIIFGIIDEADGSAKEAWEGLKNKF